MNAGAGGAHLRASAAEFGAAEVCLPLGRRPRGRRRCGRGARGAPEGAPRQEKESAEVEAASRQHWSLAIHNTAQTAQVTFHRAPGRARIHRGFRVEMGCGMLRGLRVPGLFRVNRA